MGIYNLEMNCVGPNIKNSKAHLRSLTISNRLSALMGGRTYPERKI
jgi:hypothetical protein